MKIKGKHVEVIEREFAHLIVVSYTAQFLYLQDSIILHASKESMWNSCWYETTVGLDTSSGRSPVVRRSGQSKRKVRIAQGYQRREKEGKYQVADRKR